MNLMFIKFSSFFLNLFLEVIYSLGKMNQQNICMFVCLLSGLFKIFIQSSDYNLYYFDFYFHFFLNSNSKMKSFSLLKGIIVKININNSMLKEI
jgi:hypothetical protein